MNANKRVLIELLAPPGLAALLLTACDNASTFIHFMIALPGFVLLAYAVGIWPTAPYMGLMELWFRRGFHARFGIFATVAVSAVLGAGAGLLLQSLMLGMSLVRTGALVGLLVGLYVGSHEPRVSKSPTMRSSELPPADAAGSRSP